MDHKPKIVFLLSLVVILGCATLDGTLTAVQTPTAMEQRDAHEGAITITPTPTATQTPTRTAVHSPTSSSTQPPYSMVELEKSSEELSSLLYEKAQQAERLGRAPYIQCTADWCPSCRALERSMNDERMIAAYSGTYIILVDVDIWLDRLPSVGLYVTGVPSIYELTYEGKPTGRFITGAAWGDNIPENMAPPLDAFFHPGK
jgi:hypothetical protein